MYLDIPSARRSSYSSYGRRREGSILRRIGFALIALVLIAIGASIYQWTRGIPKQTLSETFASAVTSPGTAAKLPWPSAGQAAVAVAGGATLASSTDAKPAAIASLAKMMTAYQVLTDHPIKTGSGPSLTVTAADEADFRKRLSQQQSVLHVVAGERLTEYKALQALMIPSANNVAVLLARWDAGSVAKFLTKMNATAQKLGMSQTHYADPDGTSAQTQSTAVDQLTLAQKAMTVPLFARIVRQPVATFPIAGALFNYNYMIGHHGFIGIKTGSDSHAGGCWAFAAQRTVDGKATTVYGVVLGQRARTTGALIQPALNLGRRLADATPGVVKRVTLVAKSTPVGTLDAKWRSGIPLITEQNLSVVAAPGQKYDAHLALHVPSGSHISANTIVGTLTVAGVSTPVVTSRDAPGPTLKWRLTRL